MKVFVLVIFLFGPFSDSGVAISTTSATTKHWRIVAQQKRCYRPVLWQRDIVSQERSLSHSAFHKQNRTILLVSLTEEATHFTPWGFFLLYKSQLFYIYIVLPYLYHKLRP